MKLKETELLNRGHIGDNEQNQIQTQTCLPREAYYIFLPLQKVRDGSNIIRF